MRPTDLFDREREWADLETFVASDAPGVRIGIVFGRRRTGKSFLLRRLVAAFGGLYRMALEEEPLPALQRFADGVADGMGLGPGSLRFTDWEQALRAAIDRYPLVVLDEFPYLLRHAPGQSIPSILQLLVDASRDHPASPPRRVILCGSALAVMTELLSGTKPLRGRADLNVALTPFDFRTMSTYFGITDPQIAFRLHAFVGGTPGYRDLLADASPQNVPELDELVSRTLLNPSHALFGEAGYLLREDPRVTDRALYHSILTAIAGGAGTPAKIAGVVGRPERSLAHSLDVLLTAGFITRDDDVLLQRRPALRVADPIVRFHELVTAPRLAAFEDRLTTSGWADAQTSVDSRILGPHFETLAREWVRRFAAATTTGGAVGEVGSTVVNDRAGRSQVDIDVVALATGQRRQAGNATVRVLGEAKASSTQRGIEDLTRLDRARALLVSRGVDAGSARLLIFGRSGFDADLAAAARGRTDVELIDMDRLWAGA